MDLPVFRYIQSEFLVGAISTRRFICVILDYSNILTLQQFNAITKYIHCAIKNTFELITY